METVIGPWAELGFHSTAPRRLRIGDLQIIPLVRVLVLELEVKQSSRILERVVRLAPLIY